MHSLTKCITRLHKMYFINIIYKSGVIQFQPDSLELFCILIIMRVSDIACGDEVNTINLCMHV